MEYFETSAKNNHNIQELMGHIMDKVHDNLYGQGPGSLGEEIEHGKQSVVLKRPSNTNESKGNMGSSDCRCTR